MINFIMMLVLVGSVFVLAFTAFLIVFGGKECYFCGHRSDMLRKTEHKGKLRRWCGCKDRF